MLTYYIAYGAMLIAAIWWLSGQRVDREKAKRNYCIFFVMLWSILLGLRHPSMGVDLLYGSLYGYLGRFEYISLLTWGEAFRSSVQNYEVGYIVFNKLLSYLGSSYQVLLLGCAVVSIGLIGLWIYKNSDYPFFSSIVYLGLPCFIINYSGLRQGIAISITVWAFEMIKKRRIMWFVALVLLAASFHSSAIVFLVAYPVYHIRMNKGASVATIVLIPITYIFRVPLFRILSKLLKENAKIDNNGAITLFLVFWLIFIFALFFGHEEDQEELGSRNIFLLACICQAFGGVNSTAMRVGYYFMIYAVVMLPRIIANTYKLSRMTDDRRSGLVMYVGIFVCFFAFGLFSLSRGSWAMSNPYSFFWQ